MKNLVRIFEELKGFIFTAALASSLSGCMSVPGAVLPDQARSLNEIRHAIVQIFGGKSRDMSENQRELWSPYFSRKPNDPNFSPDKSKERLTAHFWILGDRRPYEIHVQVIVEHKVDGVYEEDGEDEALSQKLADQLVQSLTNSLDKRNLIDDVRPF